MGRKGQQHLGVSRYLHPAHEGEDHEPDRHDRAEQAADAAGASYLHGKQGDDDHETDGQHDLLELGRNDFQPFDGREYRDGRGDDAVAKEQACAAYADHAEQSPHARARTPALGQCHEGEDTTLAVVVGPHDKQHVLDGDDQHERPEDQGQDAQDFHGVHGRRAIGCEMGEAGLQRIERACADIAVDDPEHTENGHRAHRRSQDRRIRMQNAAHGWLAPVALQPVAALIVRSCPVPWHKRIGVVMVHKQALA